MISNKISNYSYNTNTPVKDEKALSKDNVSSVSVGPSTGQSNSQGDISIYFNNNVTDPSKNLIIEKETPLGNNKKAIITFLVKKFVKDNLPQEANSQKPNESFEKLLVKKLIEIDGITPKRAEIFLNKMAIQIKEIVEQLKSMQFKEILKNTAYSQILILIFVRDVIWAWMAYAGTDWIKDEDSELISQTITHTIFAMLAMAVVSAIYHPIKRYVDLKNGKTVEAKTLTILKLFLLILGAGLFAIPAWNYMQYFGYNLGIEHNMSTRHASYLSSAFPGILEGPIQGLTSKLLTTIDDGVGKSLNEFKRNPRENILSFLVKLIIFGTLGGISSGMWQVVYQGMKESVDENSNMPVWSRILTISVTLAFVVYLCGLFFITGYEYVFNNESRIKMLINNVVDKTSVLITDSTGKEEVSETTALLNNPQSDGLSYV